MQARRSAWHHANFGARKCFSLRFRVPDVLQRHRPGWFPERTITCCFDDLKVHLLTCRHASNSGERRSVCLLCALPWQNFGSLLTKAWREGPWLLVRAGTSTGSTCRCTSAPAAAACQPGNPDVASTGLHCVVRAVRYNLFFLSADVCAWHLLYNPKARPFFSASRRPVVCSGCGAELARHLPMMYPELSIQFTATPTPAATSCSTAFPRPVAYRPGSGGQQPAVGLRLERPRRGMSPQPLLWWRPTSWRQGLAHAHHPSPGALRLLFLVTHCRPCLALNCSLFGS